MAVDKKSLRKIIYACAITLLVFLTGVFCFAFNELTINFFDGQGNAVFEPGTKIDKVAINFSTKNGVGTFNGLKINFPEGFDISKLVKKDFKITQGDNELKIKNFSVNGQDLQLVMQNSIDNSDIISLTISNGHLLTPARAGTYSISVSAIALGSDGIFGGTDEGADTVVDNDSASITIGKSGQELSNDETFLTLKISSDFCDLGTLSPENIKTCGYLATTNANNSTGYSILMSAGGVLKNGEGTISGLTEDSRVKPKIDSYGLATTIDSGVVPKISDNNSDDEINQADCSILNDQNKITLKAYPLGPQDIVFKYFDQSTSATFYNCQAVGAAEPESSGVYLDKEIITAVPNF
ncbi:MAG: hypothetical protein PHC97_03685 [Patescibacteria group bacterium]|nr:hypothetical protein [Patescibacteria group bacterium]